MASSVNSETNTYRILISAAETSADVHAAHLLRALKKFASVQAFGVGGPELQAEGLECLVDAKDLLAMGFTEVLGRIPKALEALDTLQDAAETRKPDLAVVLDYPVFHFKLAKRLKTLNVPVLYYIPPKVWAWRSHRVKKMGTLFSDILCVFPFEREFYQKNQIASEFVGNPLQDELPLQLTRQEARTQLGLRDSDRVLLLMPGSRPAELKQHCDLFLDASARAAALLRSKKNLGENEPLVVLIPVPKMVDFERIQSHVKKWLAHASGHQKNYILDVRVLQGHSHEGMKAADAGLIKSGTSTLEAALLGCVHSIVYKPNLITCFLVQKVFRFKKPAGLVNWILNALEPSSHVVKEFICQDATEKTLSQEIVGLLTDIQKREALATGFETVKRILIQSESPSERAANYVFKKLSRQS